MATTSAPVQITHSTVRMVRHLISFLHFECCTSRLGYSCDPVLNRSRPLRLLKQSPAGLYQHDGKRWQRDKASTIQTLIGGGQVKQMVLYPGTMRYDAST